ncbi:transporter [Aquipseudomonas ullengensis]|uniref:Transporter n=1 Tax=Aquipseudomonas ullengensis TaxID=2759166 RepID=A0A7W4LP02_9GAMM|nr:transporter [Pseudomonas ullengensis]MBB2496520.1 transporter [Pseudomonas ullengensis]
MASNNQWICTASTLAAALCLAPATHAEDSAELAKQALNPVAAMYSLPVQYNWDQKMGPSGDGMRSLTNIQPVLPFTLNDDWNLISRTILPVIDQHGLAANGAADKSGVGDITQSFFFSPRKPTASGWILGAGPALLIPTASDELLGSEQWGLGPTVVALKQSNGWTHGVLANHIWGLEGSPADDKDKVNQTFMQPFLSYTNATLTTFGVNSESTYNWQSREWSVPVNLTVTQLLKLGGQPLTVQAGPRYWLDSPTDGPQGWGFRVAVTFLFPR